MKTTSRPVVDTEAGRRADLAQIHIAKKDLGWDDDFYRDILFSLGRKRSAGDLDFTGRKLVLAHMRACGWTPGAKRKPGAKAVAGAAVATSAGASGKPARPPLTRHQGKLWGLWQQLADAGRVQDRSMAALNAWIKGHQRPGPDRLEWLNGPQLDWVIEAAKKWLARKDPA